MRHIDAADIPSKGARAAARDALTYVHADAHEFVLHLDTDVIANEEFPAVNVPAGGGLRLEDVRAALGEFVKHKNLLGPGCCAVQPRQGSRWQRREKTRGFACRRTLRAPRSSSGSRSRALGSRTRSLFFRNDRVELRIYCSASHFARQPADWQAGKTAFPLKRRSLSAHYPFIGVKPSSRLRRRRVTSLRASFMEPPANRSSARSIGLVNDEKRRSVSRGVFADQRNAAPHGPECRGTCYAGK